jgi:signal recognition particle receptor subunit beta
MVELNHRDRTIKVKLVYYGPPVGGKTTNLQILHRSAAAKRRGELISINSAQDRTILFDLLPLRTPGFRGFDLRLQVLAVPGQAMYSATRRLVLKGADSLVFVANSALDRWEENIQSYREMTQNLVAHRLDPGQMPLVLQYNKRDLPQVLEVEALDRALNMRHTDVVPAIAVRGEGVLETFGLILARTVQDLANRYAILDVKEAAPARQWAEQALVELFGRTRLGPEPAEPAAAGAGSSRPAGTSAPPASAPGPPPIQTVVRVSPSSTPEEAARGTGADARAGELVETYAEASAQLGAALTELREERDLARQRLDDLRRTMTAAQDLLAGKTLETALEPVLARMARIAGVDHAAFWVPQPGQPPRAAALIGLAAEPVLASPAALRHVIENAARGAKPSFAFSAENLDLGQALDRPEARFSALLAVPFRTPAGLQGIGVFYYGADTARPGPDPLEHLAEIRAPSPSRSSWSRRSTRRRPPSGPRAGACRQRVARRPRAPGGLARNAARPTGRDPRPSGRATWFTDQYIRLAPALASSLDDARSLLAFGRGEIRKDAVYLEDLLAELRTPEVAVELDAAAETVAADAALLRVALRALADEVRARAGSQTAPLAIRVGAWTDSVRVSVRAQGGPAEAPTAVTAGIGLGLARRIAEMHGGSLEDAVATGEIVLTLPVA